MCITCKYCSNTHESQRCPVYDRSYSQFRKLNHFEWGCRNQSWQVPKDDKRCRSFHNMYQYNDDKEMGTRDFDVVRSTIFNFHSLRIVIITKLKTKKKAKK